MVENGVPGSGNAVLLVHRVRDPSERQKDRQRTGLLHVAISHAANAMFARVRENNNVILIGTTPTAKPGVTDYLAPQDIWYTKDIWYGGALYPRIFGSGMPK